MRVITAPEYSSATSRPGIFLGGAITGAPDWQQEAIELLRHTFATCYNPRRVAGFLPPDDPDYLAAYRAQVAWEQGYLLGADVVLFWLPRGPAALTTRFEMGWFYGLVTAAGMHTPPTRRLAVGIEAGVQGEEYYRIVLPMAGIPVYTSLHDTCAAACRLVAADD